MLPCRLRELFAADATENAEGLDEFEPKEPPMSRREADADPVDLDDGAMCERMEWREPCSDNKSGWYTYWGWKKITITS